MSSHRPIDHMLPLDSHQGAAQVTRNKLLRAGIACFAELGFHAASTRIVESAAGVNRGLIMHHWGAKLVFWKACVDALAGAFGAELRLAEVQAANVSRSERLRYFVRAFIRASAKYPEVHSVMLDEGKRDEDRLRWLVEKHVQPLKLHIEALLGEAHRAGLSPRIELFSFYYSLVGSASIFSMNPECRSLFGRDPFDVDTVSRHADAISMLLIPDQLLETEVAS